MTDTLWLRLATLIDAGVDFTADDVTDAGAVTAAGDHAPNATQNAIGSLFRTASQKGWIVRTGETRRSAAPHRKGGLIQVWRGTERGRRWALVRLEGQR